MKQTAFYYLFTITVFFLFSITAYGQTTKGTGSLLNKRYPVASPTTVSGGVTRAKKAPVQSISVNEDPVFNDMSPTELVKQAFITGCLLADNIKFGYYKKSGSTWTWNDHAWSVPNNRQMGYFKKGTSTFPINEGIILSTGIASSAMGPNNMEGRSDLMVTGASDPDLSLIAGQNMNDAAILEFDFVPAGNTMEFKYTFSSEEYLEYINSSFNDAFGFFLSGPGINGAYRNNAVNLAVLPNGDPVTINTIHPAGTNIAGQSYAAKNESYYIDNPPGSPTVQFDGGTVVLTATYAVTPCQTYHIKLCVADAYDQEFDGAVFLAAKSFNSENVLLTNYGNDIEGLDDIFEGCNDNFRIDRSNPDLSEPLVLDLVLSGTATNGVDIQTTGNQPFPTRVTIPANSSFIKIPYFSVADAITDNGETFTIKIPTSCPCAANVVYVEKTINIYEKLVINSISATDALCNNQHNGTITVNASNGTGRFDYSKNGGLTWQRSNVFSNLAPGTYSIIARDMGSCHGWVTTSATVGNPPAIIANAGSNVTICSGQSTQLNGSGGVLYSWSPATGLSATNIANPVANPTTTTTYTLTATNAAGQCSSTSTVTVTVNPSPVAGLSQLNLEICKGSSTTLTASGGNTYLWNPGGSTTSAITVSPATTTNYTVIVTAANGCSDFKSAIVTVNDIPSLFNVTGGGSYCAGGTGVAVGLSGSQTGVNYQLKLNGSNTGSPMAGTGSALSFGNKTLAGTYTVESTMTSTSCVIPMSGNAVIVVNSAPIAPTVGIITQPTCTVATGSVVINGLPAGNWTINPGAVAGTGVSKTISGLVAGTYSYTVTNSVGCTSPPTANIVINTQPVTPAVSTIGTITQPTCSVATGSVVLNGLPAGNWMLNPGAIAGTGSSKTLSGLAAGTYSYTVTNDDGCMSSPSANIIINTQPATPTAPTVGTITQPTCALSTGSVVLNSLPSGNWTINPGAIAGSGASTTITGLAAGTYSYTVTNAAGCTSTASPNIVITAAIPIAPITGTITQPTCTIATGSIVLNGLPTGTWTINPGAIAGTGASKTISGLTAGTYSYTVTNALGCVSSPTSNSVINPQPVTPTAPTVGTVIHPTCAIATGSVTLNDLPAGNWIINPGAIAGTGSSKIISGIAAGTYTFTVTNASGCTSAASANVVIDAQPVIPLAPVVGITTQPTCSVATGSVVLSGLPAGNWIINPGAIAGNTTSKTISGLSAGTYTFTVTQGCTSVPSVNIVINAQPATPSAPTAGTITHPTCTVATGSVILNGLPSGTWTINPGAIAGTGSSYTKSGLAAGTYNFTVTNSSGCSSVASADIVVNTQPVTPSAAIIGTVTQPTCTVATGSVLLSGLPAGNWTINPGAIAGTGATYTRSGLTSGTYSYIVTNSIGCTSSVSANVVINAQPSTPTAPNAGTITHPTCTVATGSVVLNGLPAGSWTINPGAIAGSGTSYTISGLTSGTYNYTVTNAAGCLSPASANIIINAQPVTPSAPLINLITQPDCGVATGSVVLGGLPAGTWTIKPGARTGSGSTFTINNLLAGTYNYTVTNSAGCTSLPSANIVIVADPGTPAAPTISTITQPSCTVASGSVLLTGLPAGSWTINPGAISGSGTSTTISGLATGTYTFTVSNGVGCISLPSISVVIDAQPITPSAPSLGAITQPTCVLSTGSVVLNGLPAGNWIINPGAVSGTGAGTTISGIPAGTYAFTVTNSVGCTSVPTANVVIVVATPTAPIVDAITQPTCTIATGSVVLSGLPSGNWTINPGATAGTGLSTTISGLAAGTRTFTVTNALGCTSTASTSVVINVQPATPSTPAIGVISQPTCTVATGSVVLNSLPAGSWIINPGAVSGTGTSKTLTGISPGTYTYTVTNAVGCTSPASANVVINAQPVTPSAPAISSITQPTCEVATGIVELAGLPAGNWTLNPGAIAGTGTAKTISGLLAGTYNYTVTNAVGCISSASANVVIIANPGTPTTPAIGAITQPTCTVSTGSVQLTGLPAGNWTINPGNIAGTGSSTTISGIVAGTYNYTVTNASGCISLPSANVVINTQPVTPSVPTPGTITQPTCAVATGSVILSGLPTGSWTINPGAIAGTGLSKTVTGLAAGTYSFTVTNSVGCSSTGTSNVVINPQPVTPSAPTASVNTQPTCAVSTGSVVLNGLPSGNWTVNPGAIAGTGSSLTIPGLAAGTRTFTVTNSVGCTSLASASLVINAQPVTPSAPAVGIITHPTCTVATGSVVLNGLPAGNWTINPGSINGNTISTTISSLAPGTYNYTVTNAAGCTSVASANININTQPLTPSAPTIGTVAQPTCSVATGSVELNDLPLGNWTINPGAIAGTGVTRIVTGLTEGIKTFTVTNASGCISPASASVTINVQPVTPSAPVVSSIIQPTCSFSTGSVVLSGLPAGNWTINPGAITGNTSSKTISGLFSGTYNYTVTNSAGCTSSASVNIVINTQPSTPTAPGVGTITQPNCFTSTGSVLLSGLPTGNWVLNPGAIAGTGATKTLSGLVAGTYAYTVTNESGCISNISDDIVINPQPVTPTAPVVSVNTQPTCSTATGSMLINGLPTGNWTINPGSISGSGSSTTLSSMAAGTYAYTVTNSVGCTSTFSANAVINIQPVTPTAPLVGLITQPSCEVASGSIVLNGLPSGNWTINPGAIAGTGTSKTIPGLVAGTYSYSVTNASGCTSLASANIVILAQPATPSSPVIGAITQPTCSTATGSIVISGLPSGNWIINPGAIAGSGANTTLTGLASGTYNYSVTNSVGCISLLSADAVINLQPVTPSAPVVSTITQPECSALLGSTVLSGLPAGNWTINPGMITGTGTSTTISNLPTGTYNYTVTNSVGCTSEATANIVVNTPPLIPATPIIVSITQPTCNVPTGSVTLGGLPPRNWIINPGGILGNTSTVTISPLLPGTYNYTVTKVGGCSSLPSDDVLINAQPPAPPVPTVSSVTQPACAGSSGTITISAPTGAGITYSINGSTYTNTTGVFTLLPAGTYPVSAKNSFGCISPSTNIVVNSAPADIVYGIPQTTMVSCSGGSDGSIKISASGGTGTINYSISPNIGIQSPAGTFNNLIAQDYTIVANDDNGCTKSISITVGTTIDITLPTITCPANVTATTNTGCTATGVALGTPVTNDNCGVASVTNNAPAAFPIGITTFTWTVTDNTGNFTTCTQTVTATDNVPPTITCPANVTATTNTGCTATGVVLGTPVTTDYCGVASVTNNAPAAFPLGITTVTWTVTDNAGNFTTCTQTVTVTDNVPPTITCPDAETATTNTGCTATGVVLGTPITTDNCGVASVTNNAPAAFPLGITTVTWTVTDNTGNFTTCTQTVTVTDNFLPTITCPANVIATTITGCTATGVALGTPVTTDNCGVASVTNNAPAAFLLGVNTVTWTVTDNSGNIATCAQTVTVTDNVPPTIISPANVVTTTNTGCTATGVALGTPVTADNCGVASVTNNAPAAFPLGVTIFTWAVTDNSGNTATSDQTVTVSDNRPPTIICPASITVNANLGFPYATGVNLGTPITSDNCGVASVTNDAPVQFPVGSTTVRWIVTDVNGLSATCIQTVIVTDTQSPVMNCPSTITVSCIHLVPPADSSLAGYISAGGTVTDNDGINAASFVLSGETSNGLTCPEVITRIYTVADVNNNFSTCSQLIIIDDKIPPVFANFPADLTVQCTNVPANAAIGTEITATDNCDPSVTITFENEVRTNGLCNGTYTLVRTWKAVDVCGNSTSKSQTIYVQDVMAPVIAALPVATTINCPAVPAFAVASATDACESAFTLTFNDVTTPGACAGSYSITRTWTASDACGNTSIASQTINVQDVTAPVIAALPAATTINCPAVPVFAVASATDACGSAFTLTFNDVTTPGACAGSYSVTRTWTASDACGNTSTASQTIHVQDVTAPVIAALPAATTINCPAVPVFAVASASDACGSALTLSFNDVTTPGVCAGSYSVTRTWTASDACGNTSTASQTINVQDVTVPVITCPASVFVQTDPLLNTASVIVNQPVVTDNCATATFSNDFNNSNNASGTYPLGLTIVKWTATDDCGNTSTCQMTVTVTDAESPLVICPPAITVNCIDEVPAAYASLAQFISAGGSATDNNGITVSSFRLISQSSDNLSCPETISRNYAIDDNDGNTSSCNQTIIVKDIIPPSFTVIPQDMTVECDGSGNTLQLTTWLSNVSATDNCGIPSITNNFTSLSNLCGATGSALVTFTATDACGNKSETSATFTIEDVTVPAITTQASDLTVECDGSGNTAALDAWIASNGGALASDICSGSVTWSNDYTSLSDLCGANGSALVTFTATDACGNKSETSATFTIEDVTVPVVTCPTAISVNTDPGACGATLVVPQPTIIESCSSVTITNSVNQTADASGFYPVGNTTIVWTINDECGNTSTCSMLVTVSDNEAPAIACPATVMICSTEQVVLGTATATDNCGIATITNNAPLTFVPGTTLVVWTATDIHGNISTCTQPVTISPLATVFAGNDIESCLSSQVELNSAQATNYTTLQWSTSGTGTFNDAASLHPVYTPSEADLAAGFIEISLQSNGIAPCGNVTDKLRVDFFNAPVVNAGQDVTLCSIKPYTLSAATAANYSAVLWTHKGQGTLSDASMLNPTYTPANDEKSNIEFKLTVYGTTACGNMVVSDIFMLNLNPAITVDAGNNEAISEGSSTSLNGTVSGGSGVFSYSWAQAEYLVSNNILNPVTRSLNIKTVFTLTALDVITGCSQSDSLTISMGGIQRPIARDDYDTTGLNAATLINVTENDSDPIGMGLDISIISNPENGAATLNEDGIILYTPFLNFTGNDTLVYMICDRGIPSKCDTARVIITIFPVRDLLEIYNLVTPDGDGKNDFWFIDGIDSYPDNEILIFNRWGDKVKEFKGYNNSGNHWDGTNDKTEYLPDGVYFYIIKIKDKDNFTGWVYVRGQRRN